jgi:hypothetical protein
MDEEDGRLGPPPGHIIGNRAYSAKYGTRQLDGFQDPGTLQLLIDVTGDRARQSARADVLADASTKSLRQTSTYLQASGARNRVLGAPSISRRLRNGWETTPLIKTHHKTR